MPCSQKDLARRLGLSTCTVSKALRGDPAVATGTRTLVNRTAADLGYRSNPHLSAIAATRFRGTRVAKEVIAFLHDEFVPGQDRAYVTAGRAHAESLGYSLQAFDVTQFSSGEHLDRTLYTRGIRGLIFGTILRPPFPIELRWDRYAVVGCETNVNPFPFDEIRVSWLAAVENALTIIATQGYQRIGIVLNSRISRHRDAMGQVAGVEASRLLGDHGQRLLPIFDWEEGADKRLARYVKTHRPDCYLVQSFDLCLKLRELNPTAPPPCACIYMSPENQRTQSTSGILANDTGMGVQAVRQINTMLREGRFGQPGDPLQIVVQHDFRLTDELRRADGPDHFS